MPEDADTNESYYIIAENTMHPNGYNLRHGAAAGVEKDSDQQIALTTTGIVPFNGAASELNAQAEAVQDVAELCEGVEDVTDVEETCLNFLREVHPDKAGDRSFSAAEVTAMLNAVRKSAQSKGSSSTAFVNEFEDEFDY